MHAAILLRSKADAGDLRPKATLFHAAHMFDRPPFRADHVGSLLRPPQLTEARTRHRAGELSRAQLTEIEDAAIRNVIALQESIGLRSITDGEFRRTMWHMDFLTRLANVERTASPVKVSFHTAAGSLERAPSATRVTGKVSRPAPIFVEHFEFLKRHTRQTPKLTVPSPSILHFRGGRRAIDSQAYPQMDEFYADVARAYAAEIADLANAGLTYLQIDEVNLAYLCDPKLRAEVSGMGEDPERLPAQYARLINECIRGRPAGMAVTMHLCRGNLEGAWMAEGGYEPVAETLFNGIEVDGYFLEYDSERAGSFAPLRFVPPGKRVVLGLVTSKSGRLESKDELKRRIDAAAEFCPLEQLALSPQCGFSSGERGNPLTPEEQTAKLTRVVEVAREVWGEA
jgi:5-methyltetrahydropteroyltriglutamate--homocysteine methyltransferase